MKKLYKDMMNVEITLPETETIIAKKIKTENHKFYLYFNRINSELNFGIELEGHSPSSSKLPNCKGFNLNWATLPFTNGSKPSLILSCIGVQNIDFFLRVTEDLKNCLQFIKEENRMISNAISRITMWQDFFKKHGENQFSPENQKGLFGELRMIELASIDIPLRDIIQSWVGPHKDSHDFHFPIFHIESKVTKRKDPGMIRIHGFEQLTPPTGKDLFLHTITVKTSATSGETVLDVEGRISAKLLTEPEILERFHSKLLDYGYPVGGFDNPLHFEIEEESFFHVSNGFPSIVRKKGVYRVEYDILLSEIEAFKIEYNSIRKIMVKINKAV